MKCRVRWVVMLMLSLMFSACTAQEKPALLVLDVPDAHSAVYSPDGTMMLTTSGGTVQIRDAASGTIVKQLEEGAGIISDASYSPDGKFVVTAHNGSIDEDGFPQNGKVVVWTVATGEAALTFPQNQGVFHAVYSPDGQRLLIARKDNMAILQDVQNAPASTDLWGIRLNPVPLAAEATGGYTVALDYNSILSAVHLLQNSTTPRYDIQVTLTAREIDACDYEPETEGAAEIIIPRWWVDAGLTITDLQTSEVIHTETLPGQPPESCPIDAPAGVEFMVGMPVASIIAGSISTVLETREGALPKGVLLRLSGGSNPQDLVFDASFSPDGSQFVTSEGYGTVFIWDAASGTAPLQALYQHTLPVHRARFSLDGTKIVTVGEDHIAIIWDAAAGTPLQTIQASAGSFFNDVMFSPDGRYIVTASTDGLVQIWNAADGKAVRQFKGHTGAVLSAVYSPNGRTILSAGGSQVMVWDVADLAAS